MSTILCKKTNKMGAKMTRPPYPGPLGQQIVEQISAEGWALWLEHQTMLINENRLSLISPEARSFLEQEMVRFLFEDSSEKPAGYRPIDTDNKTDKST